MQKIPTLFERDPKTRKVIDQMVLVPHGTYQATEKVDGTNVRLTVRSEQVVRVEKRRNPSKAQKGQGIVDPWYADASPDDPSDKHILKAVESTAWEGVDDGEWSGEAIGPGIQGNPLKLPAPVVVLFHLVPVIAEVPVTFDELREWLPQQRSYLNPDKPIEGIVWHTHGWHTHGDRQPVAKIKLKDFA